MPQFIYQSKTDQHRCTKPFIPTTTHLREWSPIWTTLGIPTSMMFMLLIMQPRSLTPPTPSKLSRTQGLFPNSPFLNFIVNRTPSAVCLLIWMLSSQMLTTTLSLFRSATVLSVQIISMEFRVGFLSSTVSTTLYVGLPGSSSQVGRCGSSMWRQMTGTTWVQHNSRSKSQ